MADAKTPEMTIVNGDSGCLHCQLINVLNRHLARAGRCPSAKKVTEDLFQVLAEFIAQAPTAAIRDNYVEQVQRALPARVAAEVKSLRETGRSSPARQLGTRH